ncbi:hypothetical protein ABH980_004318 [Bradyrhizobium ottawaense]
MPTPVTSILPVSAASPVADATTPDLVLQAGSVVDARVVSVMADNLVRIAIANLSMDVVSEVALTPGQNLQLAVSQNDGTIRLAVMSGAGEATPDQITLTPRAASLVESPPLAPSATTTRNTLTPLEQVAVTAASAEAATKQGSQAPLFANLASVVTASDLPAGLKQAVLDVLAQQTPLSPGLDGADVETAFQKSGLFFEASLAAGARPPAGTTPDLKAALLVLRQTLTTLETAAPHGAAIPAATTGTPQVAIAPAQAAGEAAQSAPPSGPEIAQTPRNANLAAAVLADVAGNAQQAAMPRTMSAGLAASLLQEVTQNLPRLTGNVPGSNKTVPDGQIFEAASRATPPPFRGALPSPQAIASPSLAPDTPLSATVHRLIDDTDAAIAAADIVANRFAPGSHRRQWPPHRPGRAAVEFRDSVRNAAGHRDGAVRDLARWRWRIRRCRQARLARALLAQRRAGRPRARADHAERRQDFRADVGGAAGDGPATPRRHR